MTLEQHIATKAMELVQLLEHHNDEKFIDKIVVAVANCDYAALMNLQDCKYCKNGNVAVPFVFANDDTHKVHYADHCPVCGRCLT